MDVEASHEPNFCDDDDEDDIPLSAMILPQKFSSLRKCMDETVRKDNVVDEEEDDVLISRLFKRKRKLADKSFSIIKMRKFVEEQVALIEKSIEECHGLEKVEEERLQSIKRDIDKCSKELANKENQVRCVREINQIHEKLLVKIEECSMELVVNEVQLCLLENLIVEQRLEFKTREMELHQIKSKEHESKEEEFEWLKKELKSEKMHFENRVKELESKEREFQGQKAELKSEKMCFESRVKELESKEKQLDSRMKEFESKKGEFEGQVKEYESKEEEFKGLKRELKSEKMHFESRVKEFESKENQLEGRMKEFESKKREFEGQKSDFVQSLIREEQHIAAVRFICAYDLIDKYQPFNLLREHMQKAKLICEGSCKKTNSIEIKDKARDEEIACLKTVLDCTSDNNLQSECLLKEIQFRIFELIRQKGK